MKFKEGIFVNSKFYKFGRIVNINIYPVISGSLDAFFEGDYCDI